MIDTAALIAALKSRHIGGVALDVYEQEADLFFRDVSNEIVDAGMFQSLLTFPNVLVTGHQTFPDGRGSYGDRGNDPAGLSDLEAGMPLERRQD